MGAEPAELIIHQLQGIRRELATVLENQRRDRELITRMSLHMDEGLAGVARDIRELKSDVVLLENQNLSRHSEILHILRRLDGLATLPDEGPGTIP